MRRPYIMPASLRTRAPHTRLVRSDRAIMRIVSSPAMVPSTSFQRCWSMALAMALALSAEKALRLITYEAARAIGMDQEIGSLGVDKWADLCVVRTDPPPAGRSPSVAEAILAAGAAGVVSTYVAGRPVYSAAGTRGAGARHASPLRIHI